MKKFLFWLKLWLLDKIQNPTEIIFRTSRCLPDHFRMLEHSQYRIFPIFKIMIFLAFGWQFRFFHFFFVNHFDWYEITLRATPPVTMLTGHWRLQYRLPGYRKHDFWELFFNSFCLKLSCGGLWWNRKVGSVDFRKSHSFTNPDNFRNFKKRLNKMLQV